MRRQHQQRFIPLYVTRFYYLKTIRVLMLQWVGHLRLKDFIQKSRPQLCPLVKWSISDCHVDMLFSIPSLGSIPSAIIHSCRLACVSCLLFGYLSVTVHAMLRLWIVLMFVSFSYVYSQQWTKSQKVREKKQKIGRKEEQIKRKAMVIQISKQIWIFQTDRWDKFITEFGTRGGL